MIENIQIQDLFVYVPSGKGSSFKEAHKGKDESDKYWGKIAFLAETGEIMTHGLVFGVNTASTIGDLGNKVDTLLGGADVEGSIEHSINAAISSLLSDTSDDGTVNTLKELLDWVKSDEGITLINDLKSRLETAESDIADLKAKDTELDGKIDAETTRATGIETSLQSQIDSLATVSVWVTYEEEVADEEQIEDETPEEENPDSQQ